MSTPAADQPGLVVVGGGAGAHACVGAYWDAGGEAPVTIISDDDRPPYFRPALTKELITGDQQSDEIALEADSWYADQQVLVRLACTVTTDRGDVPYEQLVLATGSSAATLPVPGADDPRLLSIRHAVDTERLLAAVGGGGDVLVIGSGFIGCEIAASLRRRGITVAMATMEAAPQADRLGGEVGTILGGWLADLDVQLHGGVKITGLEHGASSSAATFEGGLRLEATHVVMATGAKPNLDVPRAGGIATDLGVAVDASMRANREAVMAIGDIAHALHPIAGRRVRVEHWGDAERMGTVAGTVAAGGEASW